MAKPHDPSWYRPSTSCWGESGPAATLFFCVSWELSQACDVAPNFRSRPDEGCAHRQLRASLGRRGVLMGKGSSGESAMALTTDDQASPAMQGLVDISERKPVEQRLAGTAREQAALYRFTERLNRSVSVREACEAAVEAITSALACSRASVLLFDDAGIMQFA